MFWIALKMLFGDKLKYLTLVVGLTFCAMLMGQQGSIFCGLMSRFMTHVRVAQSPVWVMGQGTKFFESPNPLKDTDLSLVRSVSGVAWAMPLTYQITQIRLNDGKRQSAEIQLVDPLSLVGVPKTVVAGNLADLALPNAIAIDTNEIDKLGQNVGVGSTFETNDHQARIVALVEQPKVFFSYPSIYTTQDKINDFIPFQRKLLSYILVQPKEGMTPKALTQTIQDATGLVALTEDEFKLKTLQYYMKNTGIPINFGISVLLGLLVGVAISAQTLYTFTLDNLKYFGTFKAMGASQPVLIGMVLIQSMTVGLIGFCLGMGWMSAFGTIVSKGSPLAFYTPPLLVGIVFALIVFVSLFASVFSLKRVISLEPAIVFKA
jgi:putative ABC transport system permease protein